MTDAHGKPFDWYAGSYVEECHLVAGRGARTALRKAKHEEALRRNMVTPATRRSTKRLGESVTS